MTEEEGDQLEPSDRSSPSSPTNAGDRPKATRRGALWAVLAWFLWFGFSTWLIDETVLAIVRGAEHFGRFLQGAMAGLFLALLAAGTLGLLLGAVWAISIGERYSKDVVVEGWNRLKQALWSGADDEHLDRVGAIFAVVVIFGIGGAVSYSSTHAVVLGVARPENIAAIVLAIHVGVLIALWLLRAFFVAIGRAWARLLGKIPGVRWLFVRTGRVMIELVAVGVTGAGVVALLLHEKLAFLPWADVGIVAGGTVLGTLIVWSIHRFGPARRVVRITRRSVLAAAVVACGVVGALLPVNSGVALDSMSRRVVSGAAGYHLISLVLDFDGDGQIVGFGGGDCAPFNARIYSGAVDVPDNGIDENCDGRDLDMSALSELVGRWSYPVPADWPKQPDIVLITVDAFAPRSLRAFDSKRNVAPNIDEFLDQSVFFESCFAQGPSTRLSFPAMFSSQFDTQIRRVLRGRWPFGLPDENLFIAEVLESEGYRTVAVAPHTYFTETRWKGISQGFETVDTKPAKGYSTKKPHTAKPVTESALRLLKEKDDRPLFLWVHYFDAHAPHRQPAGGKSFGKKKKDLYEAELRYVDQHFGELLRAIRQERPEALVILSGDHGIGFDSPRHAKKGYGHDLSTVVLHVPLAFQAPFLTPRRVMTLSSTLDIAPTIVNTLRLKRKLPFYGHSLVPDLAEGVGIRPPIVFSQYFVGESALRNEDPLRKVSVRTPRYNVVLDRSSGRVQAWDWTKDYEERKNLWADAPSSIEREELDALKNTLDLFVYEIYDREDYLPPKKKRKKKKKPRRKKRERD